MKPLEYLKKYDLKSDAPFNKEEFLADLQSDFSSVIEFLQVSKQLNETRMKGVIRDFESKVNSISLQSNSLHRQTIKEAYNLLKGKVIQPLDNELFGQARKARFEKRQQDREALGMNFFENLFFQFVMANLKKLSAPIHSFELLGLPSSATTEEIKNKFKELAKVHHPDSGGSANEFIKISEAKNQCLQFANLNKG